MSAELKETIDKIGQAFAEFKAANDERLKQIEKNGHADPILEGKIEKINTKLTDLDDLKSRIDEVETKANRPNGDGLGGEEKALRKSHSDAFTKYMRRGDQSALQGLDTKALRVGSEPDGGYVVPAAMSDQIISVMFETSPIRSIANVISIGTDRFESLVDKDEAGSGWVEEQESRAETDTPELAKIEIPVHEQYAEPRATQKILDDADFDIEGWLSGKVAEKMARTENTAFVTGNGVGRPRGLASYTTVANASWSATSNWGTVGHLATGASGGWNSSDPGDTLYDVVYALKPEYLANARWVMRRALIADVRKFQDGQGNYLWQPGLAAGQPATLVGYPITPAEDMPAKAANSLSVAFGDFRAAYTIVDRTGVRVIRDPYTTKPYVKFYTTKRVGGATVNFDAYKLIKFAAS